MRGRIYRGTGHSGPERKERETKRERGNRKTWKTVLRENQNT